jgi:hypothetical protein
LKPEERKRGRKKKRRVGERKIRGRSLRRFIIGRGIKSVVLSQVSPASPNLTFDTKIIKERKG